MAQSMTPIGLAALKSREGVRLQAYRDSVGVPTIGWGHTAGVKMGDTITLAQASAFLEQDIDTHAAPILAAVKVPLADHEQDALVSIAFNIGVGAFRKSTFLKRLNAGDRAGCAKAIMSWTKPPEITSRREAERDQFLTPYDVALPKARSNDAGPVKGVTKPAGRPVSDRVSVSDTPHVETVAPAGLAPGLFESLWNRMRGRAAVGVPVIAGSRGDPTIFYVQKTLREKAYYTKGFLDGLDGGLTQGAVAQARKDNGMGDGGIDAAFLARLPTFPQRPVSTERAHVTLTQASEHAPELFTPPKWLISAGLGSLGLGGASGAGLMDNVKSGVATANDVFGQVQTALGYVSGAVAFIVEHKTLFLIAAGLLLVWKGVSAVLSAWIKVRQAFF